MKTIYSILKPDFKWIVAGVTHRANERKIVMYLDWVGLDVIIPNEAKCLWTRIDWLDDNKIGIRVVFEINNRQSVAVLEIAHPAKHSVH